MVNQFVTTIVNNQKYQALEYFILKVPIISQQKKNNGKKIIFNIQISIKKIKCKLQLY